MQITPEMVPVTLRKRWSGFLKRLSGSGCGEDQTPPVSVSELPEGGRFRMRLPGLKRRELGRDHRPPGGG